MRRWLAASAALGALAVAVFFVMLSFDSFRYVSFLQIPITRETSFAFASREGSLLLVIYPRYEDGLFKRSLIPSIAMPGGHLHWFRWYNTSPWKWIGVPLWLPAFTFIALAWRIWKRRPSRDGFCHRCGYDLRASTDRCPECGSPIAAADSSSEG